MGRLGTKVPPRTEISKVTDRPIIFNVPAVIKMKGAIERVRICDNAHQAYQYDG